MPDPKNELELSDRERQALTLLRSGLRMSEVARRMGVSRERVRQYVRHMEARDIAIPEYTPPPKPPPPPPKPKPVRLTPTQKQVLKLLKAGKTQVEVAAEMGVGKSRIGQHIARFRELGVEVPGYEEPRRPPPRPRQITPRQQEILTLLKAGHSHTETGKILGIGRARVGAAAKLLREQFGEDV